MANRARRQFGTGIVVIFGVAAALADGPGAMERLKKAVGGSKISLSQAVEATQKEVADGKVIEVEFQWPQEPACFSSTVLVGEKVREVKIETAAGKVLSAEDVKPDEAETKEIAEARRALAAAKIVPAAAIAAAEKEVKDGKAIGIELEEENGQPSYSVTLLQGDKLMEAEVDAVTGKVTKTEEEPTPLALWTFDQAEVGKTPAGLLAKETHAGPKPGEWKVAADATAPSKPNVLTLTTQEPDATFNVALFEKTAYKDVDLRVRIRSNAGKEDQGGGLIWHAKDENNYYICRINPLENNFRVYKVVDGKRSQLQSTEHKAVTGQWHSVRAVMVGDRIVCYVDGKQYLDVKDDTFKDAGMIGLWTKADASSSFDNLALYAPAAMSPAKPAADSPGQKKDEDRDDDD